MRSKLTSEIVISRFKDTHGSKYDYSKVEYVNSNTKVRIVCPKHGEFLKRPFNHIYGEGCPECSHKKRGTTEKFIQKAINAHGYKYDYSKVEYKSNRKKVCIVCPKHGEFWQTPFEHASVNQGCPICGKEKIKKLRYGVGYNDLYKADRKMYKVWDSMLSRCYNKHSTHQKGSYKGCSVCEEWHKLSNFKKWYDLNFVEGYALDKDILVKGNKVYSPETCCFVPQKINSLINMNKKNRGACPIGVKRDKRYGYIISYISYNGKPTNLGTFKDYESAFFAYKQAKEQYVRDIAEKHYNEGKITEKVYNALMRYEVEITD